MNGLEPRFSLEWGCQWIYRDIHMHLPYTVSCDSNPGR